MGCYDTEHSTHQAISVKYHLEMGDRLEKGLSSNFNISYDQVNVERIHINKQLFSIGIHERSRTRKKGRTGRAQGFNPHDLQ